MTVAELIRGLRRAVEPPRPPVYDLQVRRTLPNGKTVVQRHFVYKDLAAATEQFNKLRRIGGCAYTAEHGYRLVLLPLHFGGHQ